MKGKNTHTIRCKKKEAVKSKLPYTVQVGFYSLF